MCRVKYNNTLPDIPFDPKFLAYPFEANRFIHYASTSLERNYKYELLTEPDLGVEVNLILPEAYEKPEDEIVSESYHLLYRYVNETHCFVVARMNLERKSRRSCTRRTSACWRTTSTPRLTSSAAGSTPRCSRG